MQLTVTQGPLRSRQVLLLEPLDDGTPFRFKNLPPDLRSDIYDMCLKEDQPIYIETIKPVRRKRRASRFGFADRYAEWHRGMTWDTETMKWLEQPPSTASLLIVSKQIRYKAGAVLYGRNIFVLGSNSKLAIFLEGIGEMRQFVRDVRLTGPEYFQSTARKAFRLLGDAHHLHTLVVEHRGLCCTVNVPAHDDLAVAERLAADCETMMKNFRKARENDDQATRVVDIVHVVDHERCSCCETGMYECVRGSHFCRTRCAAAPQHCHRITANLRALIAQQLGIVRQP